MNKLRYGSVAVGAPGSIARRRAELQDIIACAERWIERSYGYGPDMLGSAASCLNDAQDVLQSTQLDKLPTMNDDNNKQ